MESDDVFKSDKELFQYLLDGGEIVYIPQSIDDAYTEHLPLRLSALGYLENSKNRRAVLNHTFRSFKKYIMQYKEIDFADVPDYLIRGAVLRPKTVHDEAVSMLGDSLVWYSGGLWCDPVVVTRDLMQDKWVVVKEPTK